MKEVIVILKGDKKPGEGIMQMVEGFYMNCYIFKLEFEEIELLVQEMDWEELDYTIVVND